MNFLYTILLAIIALVAVVAAKPEFCNLPPSTGNDCQGFRKLYYYDTKTKSCKTFEYGCDGNGNHFETQAECEKTCK